MKIIETHIILEKDFGGKAIRKVYQTEDGQFFKQIPNGAIQEISESDFIKFNNNLLECSKNEIT